MTPTITRHWRLLRVWPVVLGAAALLSALAPASAQPASGAGVVLETYSLGAGGGALQGPQGAGLPSRADVSVGPPTVIGLMQGGGITLEAGFWPTVVTVPEPNRPLLLLATLASLAALTRRTGTAGLREARHR